LPFIYWVFEVINRVQITRIILNLLFLNLNKSRIIVKLLNHK